MALARPEGLEDIMAFQAGNAEALPLGDRTIDVALSMTIMKLLDTGQMLPELIRVTRPIRDLREIVWGSSHKSARIPSCQTREVG